MLNIGAFSKISNVTTKTLRYYDEIGLLKPVHVNRENGYRYYDVAQLKTILLINKLKSYCFSLDEISEVLSGTNSESKLLWLIRHKHHIVAETITQYEHTLQYMEEDIANLERGVNIMAYLEEIQVKLTETAPTNILSVRDKINVSEYGTYMGKLYEQIAREKLTPMGAPLSIFHDEEFNPESYDMEIAVPVKETAQGTRIMSSGLCAMATLRGPYSQLTSVYAKLKEWIEAECYENAGPSFEIYLTDPGKTPPEQYITEVYVPIKKQKTA